LHKIDELNGKVVSVTTDGFITNISSLEEKCSMYLFNQYKTLRFDLSENRVALEVKTEGKGVIS
jgi:hypothetical protein